MEKEKKYKDEVPRSPYYIREKVPIVIQMEVIECGAACLASILAYYGKYVTLEQLRIDAGVTRDGVSVYGIINAAHKHKLYAEAFQTDIQDLFDMPLPFIAYWNFEHFIIIEGFSREGVYIMDPALGTMTITYDDLSLYFSEIIILLDPQIDFVKSGKPYQLGGSLYEIFKREKSSFIFAFLTGILLILPQLALPAFAQIFIDNIITGHIYNWKNWLLFGVVFIFALTFFLKYLELNVLSRLYIKLSTTYSGEFLWHILRLPYNFYLQRSRGEIANRMTLNDNVYNEVSTQLAALFIDAFVAVIFGLAMFYYDVWISAIAILLMSIEVYSMRLLFVTRLDAFYYYQKTFGTSFGYAVGSIGSMETIKSISSEYPIFSRLAGYYTKNLNAVQTIGKRDAYSAIIPYFIQFLTTISVLSFGAYRVINGSLTVGMLVALILLMELLLIPITRLLNTIQSAQFLKINMTQIKDILDNPLDHSLLLGEKNNEKLLKEFSYSKLKGYLELKDITFGYDRTGDPILSRINFSLTPGQMVAIVGSSGSGKSTLSRLVANLFEPWQGEILFDHIRRDHLPRSVIINSLGVVEQESSLFYGTIKENISFYNPLLEQEEIIRAAKDACIHEEILLRKGGYDLIVHNSGTNLSGGQRQRLEIARVLAREPTVLVLDEATSALDPETEMKVMQNIRNRGCTALVIAHRISSTLHCDEIIVLEKGVIVERGTHEELVNLNGLYKSLYELEQLTQNTN